MNGDGRLWIESDGEMLKAEVRHGVCILEIEASDPNGGNSDFIRTRYLPTKAQADALAEFLRRWAAPNREAAR